MRWKVVLISFLGFHALISKSQSLEQTHLLAQNHYALSQNQLAKEYFERLVFFDTNKAYVSVYKQLSDLYVQDGNDQQAIKCLQTYQNYTSTSDSNWYDLGIEIAAVELQFGKEKEALAELLQLKYMQIPDAMLAKFNLYMAVAYFQNKDFENSEAFFYKVISSQDSAALAQIFKKNNRLERRYNLYRLQIMSILVPGSGQTYAGFYKEGINSAVLVGAFMVLFFHTANIYGFADAFIAVYPWVSRYHLGGVKKTALLSKQGVAEKRAKYYQEILKLVQ